MAGGFLRRRAPYGHDADAFGSDARRCRSELPRAQSRQSLRGRKLGVPDQRCGQSDLDHRGAGAAARRPCQGTSGMSDRARWSRRDTLACGILTAIAACGARRVVAETVAGALPDGGLLYALFPELGQAGTLSRACLRFFPASISADRLYAWIVPADRPELENAPTIAELRRSIGQRVRRDFAVDDTVQV